MHPNPQRTPTGMHSHMLQTPTKTILRHDRIGIQKEDVFTGTHRRTLVAGTAKTRIFLVPEKSNSRKPRRQIPAALVPRSIVDHDDLTGHTLRRPAHRQQTLLQEKPDIMIDNDDGQGHPAPKITNASTPKGSKTLPRIPPRWTAARSTGCPMRTLNEPSPRSRRTATRASAPGYAGSPPPSSRHPSHNDAASPPTPRGSWHPPPGPPPCPRCSSA